MMSQLGALSSLFDDEALSQEQLLWPLHHGALSPLQKNFFSRRAQLAESLLRGFHNELTFSQFPAISSTLARVQERDAAHKEQHEDIRQVSDKNSDLLVTLDARGYAPGDITVKLDGRSLALVAMKQAGEEENQSCSSSTSSASFSSSASSQAGFMQKIDLPAHLDLSGLSCSLMDDGQLRVHAPVAKQPIDEEHQVPIRYRTSLEFPITKDGEEHKD